MIVVFEGWDAAGKGSSIQALTARRDPRGFKLYPIREARTYEKNGPGCAAILVENPRPGRMGDL